MITFQFETTFPNVRVAVVKKGKILHPIKGWVDIPASGEPLPEHCFIPERFAAAGSLSEICELNLNVDARYLEGAGAVIYSSDTNGGNLKRQMYLSVDYACQQLRYVGLGTFLAR